MKVLILFFIVFCITNLHTSFSSIVGEYKHHNKHGFVAFPPSRAYLCHLRLNYGCGDISYEPQSVEGPKGFPESGPVDGKIASAGVERFKQLDEYGDNRWIKIDVTRLFKDVNETHVYMPFSWVFTQKHETLSYQIFASNSSFSNNAPISRSGLELVKDWEFKKYEKFNNFNEGESDSSQVLNLTITKDYLTKMPSEGIFLCVWQISDNDDAFYQVVDYRHDTM